MQRVIVVADGHGRAARLVGRGRSLRRHVAVGVVAVGDGAGLGVGGGGEATQRIIDKRPCAPVAGVGIVALLVHASQIVEDVVLIIGLKGAGCLWRQIACGGI